MASQGPNNCTSATNDATVGTINWNNLTNVYTSDNAYAGQGGADPNGITKYLKCVGYGFSLPNSTIDGIVLTMKRYTNGFGGSCVDNSIKLVIANVISGNEKSTGAAWPEGSSNAETKTFGSSSDLWGTSPTYSQINAADFGVVISANMPTVYTYQIANIDYMQITVYYTLAAANNYYQNSNIRAFSQTRHGIWCPIGPKGIQVI